MSACIRRRSRAKAGRLSAADAIALRGRPDIAIVDLREKSEREKHGVIPGSLHAPYPSLQDEIGAGGMLHELAAASGKRIVFYCAFGERSAMAVQAAQDAGLKTACHIAGGIDAWKKANGPLVRIALEVSVDLDTRRLYQRDVLGDFFFDQRVEFRGRQRHRLDALRLELFDHAPVRPWPVAFPARSRSTMARSVFAGTNMPIQ